MIRKGDTWVKEVKVLSRVISRGKSIPEETASEKEHAFFSCVQGTERRPVLL